MIKIKKGETWYIKHQNAKTLVARKVLDVTEKTVSFETKYSGEERYLLSDIEFIEQVKRRGEPFGI